MTTNILTIAGSLRRHSFNRRLLRAALHAAPAGISLREWDGLAAIPPFDEDGEAESLAGEPAVAGLRDAIQTADGLLIATPEYNGSIPGQLKNAMDWASRPHGAGVLTGKPVVVIGASPSPYGAAWSQAELRKVLGRSGADVVDGQLAVAHAPTQFDEHDRLLDHELRNGLRDLLTALHARTRESASAA